MTKFFWFSIDGGGVNYNWLRGQALELCNMLGVRLGELIEEPVYEEYITEALFSRREIKRRKLVKYKYHITVEGTVPSEKTVPMVLSAWCKGYNATRRQW